MAKHQQQPQATKRARTKDTTKKIKKKISVLVQERVEYVDYKDVNLLQRFMSRPLQDPRPPGHRQRRPAAARHRHRRSRTPARWRCCPTPSGSPPSAAARPIAATAATRRPGRSRRPRRSRERARSRRRRRRRRVDDRRRRGRGRDRTDGRRLIDDEAHPALRPRRRRQARRHLSTCPTGYARNYLLPEELAIVATDGAVAQAGRDASRPRPARRPGPRRRRGVARTLVPKVITIRAKAGSEGRLFGSVTRPTSPTPSPTRPASSSTAGSSCSASRSRRLGTHSVAVRAARRRRVPVTVEVVAG